MLTENTQEIATLDNYQLLNYKEETDVEFGTYKGRYILVSEEGRFHFVYSGKTYFRNTYQEAKEFIDALEKHNCNIPCMELKWSTTGYRFLDKSRIVHCGIVEDGFYDGYFRVFLEDGEQFVLDTSVRELFVYNEKLFEKYMKLAEEIHNLQDKAEHVVSKMVPITDAIREMK